MVARQPQVLREPQKEQEEHMNSEHRSTEALIGLEGAIGEGKGLGAFAGSFGTRTGRSRCDSHAYGGQQTVPPKRFGSDDQPGAHRMSIGRSVSRIALVPVWLPSILLTACDASRPETIGEQPAGAVSQSVASQSVTSRQLQGDGTDGFVFLPPLASASAPQGRSSPICP